MLLRDDQKTARQLLEEAIGRRAAGASGMACEAAEERVAATLRALGLIGADGRPSPDLAKAAPVFGGDVVGLIASLWQVVRWIDLVEPPPGAPFSVALAAVEPTPGVLPASTPDGSRIAAGCGATPAEAVLATAAEAVERYCLQYRSGELTIRAAAAALPDAVDLRVLLSMSGGQLAATGLDAASLADRVRDWRAADVATGAARLVPASHLRLGYPAGIAEGWPAADSSGAAVGRNADDAALRALLELVERDAVAIWWYNRLRRPPIPAEALDDPWLVAVHTWLDEGGRDMELLHLATDLAVPVAACVSRERTTGRLCLGTGTGLDWRAAACAAVREHLQALVNLVAISSRPRGSLPSGTAARFLNWHEESAAAQRHLRADPLAAGAACPPGPVDLPTLLETLARAGREVLLFDMTDPLLGLPVVRAVVPGLCSTKPLFGPCRLFELPVAQGWLSRPPTEAELNPVPFPY